MALSILGSGTDGLTCGLCPWWCWGGDSDMLEGLVADPSFWGVLCDHVCGTLALPLPSLASLAS